MKIFLRKRIWWCIISIFLVGAACQNSSKDFGGTVIVVNEIDLKKPYKLSDVMNEFQLIPLETNDSCLIGECTKISIVNDLIYVLDAKSNQLLCFDKQGRYIKKIGEIGRGPNEYLLLDDYCFLKNGNVMVLDTYPNKLIEYNAQGGVETIQKLPFCADALECLNDSVLIFNGACFEDPVILWNYRQKKRINSFLKFDEKFAGKLLKTFTKFGDEIFWSREYHQELFGVEEGELVVKRSIDFGKYNSTGEFVKGFMGLYFLPAGVASMWYYSETPDYITFHFSCDVITENPFFSFYSKKTKRNIILNQERFIDDLTYYISPPQVVTDAPNGGFIAVLQTSVWFNHLEELGKNKQYEPESFNALKEKLKDVQFSDNPVIAIYQLKPF